MTAPRRNLSADDVAELVRDYCAGASCVEVGEKYDVSRETVRRLVKQAGVQVRTPAEQREESALTIDGYGHWETRGLRQVWVWGVPA